MAFKVLLDTSWSALLRKLSSKVSPERPILLKKSSVQPKFASGLSGVGPVPRTDPSSSRPLTPHKVPPTSLSVTWAPLASSSTSCATDGAGSVAGAAHNGGWVGLFLHGSDATNSRLAVPISDTQGADDWKA